MDVFISYSRKDKSFVQKLHEGLTQKQKDSWVDWEDIPLTAEWWAEIQSGIEAAEAFIFVISPDSVVSEVCREEIAYAAEADAAEAHRTMSRTAPVSRPAQP